MPTLGQRQRAQAAQSRRRSNHQKKQLQNQAQLHQDEPEDPTRNDEHHNERLQHHDHREDSRDDEDEGSASDNDDDDDGDGDEQVDADDQEYDDEDDDEGKEDKDVDEEEGEEDDSGSEDSDEEDDDAHPQALLSRPIKASITEHFPFHLHLLDIGSDAISLLWAAAPPAVPLPDTNPNSATQGAPSLEQSQAVTHLLKGSAIGVTVNNRPWPQLLLTELSPAGDQAVLVVYGLDPSTDTNLVIQTQALASPSARPTGTMVSFADPIPRDTDPAIIELYVPADTVTTADLPSPAEPAVSLEDKDEEEAYDEDGVPSTLSFASLRRALSRSNAHREQLSASLRKARKDSSRSESNLRNEIDALQRNLDRSSAADGRTKQKILALQENVRQAKAAEERLSEEVKASQTEWEHCQSKFNSSRAAREKEQADWDAERSTQETRVRTLEDALKEQERKRDKLRAELDDREKRKEKMDAKWAKVANLEAELKRLKEEVEGVREGAVIFAAASANSSHTSGSTAQGVSTPPPSHASILGPNSTQSPQSMSSHSSQAGAPPGLMSTSEIGPISTTAISSTLRATAPAFFAPNTSFPPTYAGVGDLLQQQDATQVASGSLTPRTRLLREHALANRHRQSLPISSAPADEVITSQQHPHSPYRAYPLLGSTSSVAHSLGEPGGSGLDPHKPEFVPTWLQSSLSNQSNPQDLMPELSGPDFVPDTDQQHQQHIMRAYGHPNFLQPSGSSDLFVPQQHYLDSMQGYSDFHARDAFHSAAIARELDGLPNTVGQRRDETGEDGGTDSETVDGDDLDFDPTLKLPPSFSRSRQLQSANTVAAAVAASNAAAASANASSSPSSVTGHGPSGGIPQKTRPRSIILSGTNPVIGSSPGVIGRDLASAPMASHSGTIPSPSTPPRWHSSPIGRPRLPAPLNNTLGTAAGGLHSPSDSPSALLPSPTSDLVIRRSPGPNSPIGNGPGGPIGPRFVFPHRRVEVAPQQTLTTARLADSSEPRLSTGPIGAASKDVLEGHPSRTASG
ncbi:hypothetical protein OC846_005318 [Tilletia horrida]|uniref:Uncharacterized protein n=1 Tax=Tilletia horrida TaxID=155126 RepID=A0AAN6JW36_9BASI|nr:hypothetical protein OC846_005318 [Tilletia horrida]KAK0562066.1 hypothetical protein OC861_005503 [Tilletia horrida]